MEAKICDTIRPVLQVEIDRLNQMSVVPYELEVETEDDGDCTIRIKARVVYSTLINMISAFDAIYGMGFFIRDTETGVMVTIG